jgi:hypothetical protein
MSSHESSPNGPNVCFSRLEGLIADFQTRILQFLIQHDQKSAHLSDLFISWKINFRSFLSIFDIWHFIFSHPFYFLLAFAIWHTHSLNHYGLQNCNLHLLKIHELDLLFHFKNILLPFLQPNSCSFFLNALRRDFERWSLWSQIDCSYQLLLCYIHSCILRCLQYSILCHGPQGSLCKKEWFYVVHFLNNRDVSLDHYFSKC